ncbi:type I-B CRISPR-associated protein Cas7/Cst2/DevR [uncultured Eubacterium sp.]|uniref:type I-B CRISPR-associated protein Cas7/Cst2/DevR n=1 Tax=uncultured Eubacterium sp. TaxID=165185 RepID=UPI0026726E1A|nr:type I-B CRISPR-associated protein Cas7/Cst2/DevR [uncultured Eubacterium sp.]
MNKALTITVVANMTSNYSEGLGNISSVQKVFKNQKVYAMRSRESLKNAICVQAGLYDDLQTQLDGAMQKYVTKDVNAATCRALEGGYMSTQGTTYVRNSSFYLTDAIACESFINETRFHNNLYLASAHAKANGLNVQQNPKEVGLMPYQYEYDKSLKTYSMTIDLEMVGKDENFDAEAENTEKNDRVASLLNAIENLSLVVKGNLDNAEPIFVVGGLSDRKTHYFENVVNVKGQKLIITKDLKDKISKGFYVGLLESGVLENENDIEKELNPLSITKFFETLKRDVEEYYGV